MIDRVRGPLTAALFLALAGLGVDASVVWAQEETGAVRGRVVDGFGAPVAGAEVRVRSEALEIERATTTDGDGAYRIASITPGEYSVRVEAMGHRPAESAERRVVAGGEVVVNLTLRTAPFALEELTVTGATRTATPVSAVPGGVSVVARESLEEQARLSQNLGDLLARVVPGLGAGLQSPSVYGQSLRGRNMSVLIDGVPQSTTRNVSRDLSTIDPSAIERIEVVRGATAIYGDGATGGVINIITRSAGAAGTRFTTELSGEAALSAPGEGLGGTVRQEIAGRLGAVYYTVGATAGRTGAFYDAEGDMVPPDPHGQGGLADTERRDLFGKVGVDLGDARVRLSVNRFDSEQATSHVSDPALNAREPGARKARPLEGVQLVENQGTGNTVASLDVHHDDVLGSQVHGQLYYRDYRTVFRPFDGRNYRSTGYEIMQSWLESEKVGGRLEIETGLADTGAEVLWGVDYVDETTAQPVYTFDPAAYDESGGLVFEKTGEETWVPPMQPRKLGLFGQVSWSVGTRVQLRGGVRHERARMQIDDFTTLAGDAVRGGTLAFDPVLFNIGAVVTATDAVSLFGSFSQGFSLADVGLFLRSAPDGYDVGSKNLKAQTVDQYEVGARGRWSALSASLSGFYNHSELGTRSAGFDMAVVRAPERVYGVEATADLMVGDAWTAGGTFSWVEGGYFDEEADRYRALNGWRIQPLKLTGYLEHQTLPGWRNRLQVLHSGSRDRAYEQRSNAAAVGFGERPVDAYTTVDIMSDVAVGPGVLEIGIQNALNAQYFPVASQLMRTGGNNSYSAARGAVLTTGYTVTY